MQFLSWLGDVLKWTDEKLKQVKDLGSLAGASRMLKEFEAGTTLNDLSATVDKKVEEGAIDASRKSAPEVLTAFAELIDDLATNPPDQRRLDILRRAVIGTAKGIKDDDGTRSLIFVKTARTLTGEQAVVLRAGYQVRKVQPLNAAPGNQAYVDSWATEAMRMLNFPYRRKLDLICQELVEAGVFYGGTSLAWQAGFGVLTDFGLAFCEFLEAAEPLTSSNE